MGVGIGGWAQLAGGRRAWMEDRRLDRRICGARYRELSLM